MRNPVDLLYSCSDLCTLLYEHVSNSPERTCITIERDNTETSYTYEKLIKRASAVAEHLVNSSKMGDRIVIATGTDASFVDCFFACLLTGRIAVPVPPQKTKSKYSRINYVIKDCSPTVVIYKNAHDRNLCRTPGFENDNIIDLIFDEITVNSGYKSTFVEASIGEANVAMLQYTSGSTSNPKGVVLTHKNIISNLRMIQQGMQLSSEDRIVSWLPLHHDMGLIGMLLAPIGSGGHTHIFPYQEFSRAPLSWLEKIEKYQATVSGAPNFAFDLVNQKLAKHSAVKFDLKKIRLLYCGSERIRPSSIKAFYKNPSLKNLSERSFFPCYGLAEATLYVAGAYVRPDDLNKVNDKYPTCGVLANGLALEVRSEGNQKLPPQQVGEICIFGESISLGYWKELKTKISNGKVSEDFPFRTLATGDLGFLLTQNVTITGRKSDLIKIRGRNIYPEDIELIIEDSLDSFGPNSVVACSIDDGSEEKLVIIAEIERVMRHKSQEEVVGEIQALLSSENLMASEIIVLNPLSLPKTSSGKKQRQLTKAKLAEGQLSVLWRFYARNSSLESDIEQNGFSTGSFETYVENRVNLLLSNERRTFPADFVRQLGQFKLLSLLIPKEFGGSGLSSMEFSRVGRRLGYIDLSIASLIGNHNTIGVLPIIKSETLVNREKILKDIAANGMIAAFAITEPGAGSNPRAIETTASHQSGKIYVDGEKIWIGNANLSKYICLFAKEVGHGSQQEGISAFLLDRTKHNFIVSEEQLTLGLKPMPQNRLIFKKTLVGEEDRLALPGDGLKLAYFCMEYARFGLLSLGIGGIEKAQKIIHGFVRHRNIWTGRMGENSVVQSKLNRVELHKDAMISLLNRAAAQLDQQGQMDPIVSLTCKIVSGEWTFNAIDSCLQLAGGRGYMEPFGLAPIFRDSRILRIFEGPTEALACQLGSLVERDLTVIDKLQESGFLRNANELKKMIVDFQSNNKQVSLHVRHYHTGGLVSELIALTLLREDRRLDRKKAAEIGAEMLNRMHQYSLKTVSDNSLAGPLCNSDFAYSQSGNTTDLYDNWSERYSAVDVAYGSVAEQPMRENSDQSSSVLQNQDKAVNAIEYTDESVEQCLADWVHKCTRRKVTDFSASLVSYGMDSLLAYELLCFVEEKFGVTLPESIVTTQPSIIDIKKQIEVLSNNPNKVGTA